MNPIQTKAHLVELLRAGHTVTVRWDCGGDESFVYTSVDGQEVESEYEEENDFAYGVEELVTNALSLPSAGEFSMTGNGQFYQENDGVGLEYISDAEVEEEDLEYFYRGFTDQQLADMGIERPARKEEEEQESDEEENEEEPKMLRDEEMSKEYSGRRILFQISSALDS
ncbi:hypothetical protein J0X19_14805 [Hymenobacter sp. BT186]|uniref:Uncharacterized protein n=1 Tax=Hymenobacter telluris TaxID=2816474 RepID=A0A939J9W1_9BACT|nr:hypothetical protein [Hymenobacter telluris]MBO0359229.1 hypothetical protein [Hymenobacter telluris]MBW3375255.1 hypothetical protein [Hymenobacter norwichensis]